MKKLLLAAMVVAGVSGYVRAEESNRLEEVKAALVELQEKAELTAEEEQVKAALEEEVARLEAEEAQVVEE